MKLGNGDCNFTIKSPRFLFMVVSAMAFGERGDALWQAPACRTFIHSAGRGGGVLVVMTRRTRVRRVKFRPVADRLDRYVALVSKFWPPILSKFSADTAAALTLPKFPIPLREHMVAPQVPGVEADLASPGLLGASEVFCSASARSRWRWQCMNKWAPLSWAGWRGIRFFCAGMRAPTKYLHTAKIRP